MQSKSSRLIPWRKVVELMSLTNSSSWRKLDFPHVEMKKVPPGLGLQVLDALYHDHPISINTQSIPINVRFWNLHNLIEKRAYH